MAIDPSIALGYKTPQGPDVGQFIDTAKNAQSILQSQAQTENLKAANPGIQAESQVQQQAAVNAQRQNQAQQLSAQIFGNNTKHNPDGTTTFDTVGAANDFAKAGLMDQSHNMLKPYLDNISADADNVKKLQSNANDLNSFQVKVAGPILNMAAQIKDPDNRAKMITEASDAAKKQYPNLFPQGNTSYFDTLMDRAQIDPTGAASYAMTPTDWTKLGLEKQNAETARIGAISGRISTETQTLAQQQGVNGAVQDSVNKASLFDNGVAAVLAQRDPKTGQLPKNMASLGADALVGLITTDPRFSATRNAIAAAQAAGYQIKYQDGLEGIQQQLQLYSQMNKDAASRLVKTNTNAGRPVPAPTPVTPTVTPPGGSKYPKPQSKAAYDALPSGTVYMDSDGKVKRKK